MFKTLKLRAKKILIMRFDGIEVRALVLIKV